MFFGFSGTPVQRENVRKDNSTTDVFADELRCYSIADATGKIDADYMNSRFDKYLKVLQGGDELAREATLADLHRSFTSLSQEDQRIAEIFFRRNYVEAVT